MVAVDATPFVKAVVAEGHSVQFANDLAKVVLQMANARGFPVQLGADVGGAGYSVRAGLQDGKLVLLDLQRVVG